MADPLLMTNWMLRGAAMSLGLLLAAMLLHTHRNCLAARLGALLGAGAAAFALATAPGFGDHLQPWQAPVMGLSAGNAMVFWLFTRAVLDDGFALRRWHVAGWSTLFLLGASNCLLVRPLGEEWARTVGSSIDLSTVALAALAVAQTVVSWREDLVEARRRLRAFIVLGVGGDILVMQAVAWLANEPASQAFSGLGNAAALAVLMAGIAWALLELPGRLLFAAFQPVPPRAPRVAPPPLPAEFVVRAADPGEPGPGPEADAAAEDDALAEPAQPDPRHLAQLDELMTVEQVYREDRLTIGALAQRMGLPEHRLRRVINRGLGHRNFNAFLNTYRVQDAKRALADHRYDEVPIVTIAMEAGFQSLGPFNRAFKAAAGMTPSDYRRAAREGGTDEGFSPARTEESSEVMG